MSFFLDFQRCWAGQKSQTSTYMRPPPFSLCICAHSQCCAKVDHLLRRAGAYKFSSIKSNCKQSNYSYFIFCKSITKHIKIIFAKYPFIYFCKVSYFIKKKKKKNVSFISGLLPCRFFLSKANDVNGIFNSAWQEPAVSRLQFSGFQHSAALWAGGQPACMSAETYYCQTPKKTNHDSNSPNIIKTCIITPIFQGLQF